MSVKFDVIPYAAMPGFYVQATWPDGRIQHIDDNSVSDKEPAFKTQAEALHWIANESLEWLKRYG